MLLSRINPAFLSDINNINIGRIKTNIETFGYNPLPIISGKMSNPKPAQSESKTDNRKYVPYRFNTVPDSSFIHQRITRKTAMSVKVR